MKISIITATLNNKPGLIRAIQSVRSQTYKNVEHIIVDGGSTDGTVEALKNLQLTIKNDGNANGRNDNPLKMEALRHPDHIGVEALRHPDHIGVEALRHPDHIGVEALRHPDHIGTAHYSLLYISEADTGIYDAINKGIKLATGDVIGLLHSDDFFKDEFVLEKVAEAFTQSAKRQALSEVDAVYSDLVYVTSEGSVVRNWKAQKKQFTAETHPSHFDSPDRSGQAAQYDALRITKWIKNGWMPPHPTLFVRKEIFEKYGLYRTDMKIAADYEMILRLFWKQKITAHYLPITTCCMTIGGASNKSLKNIITKSSEDYRAMKIHSLPFPFYTLLCKNLRKLPQFFVK